MNSSSKIEKILLKKPWLKYEKGKFKFKRENLLNHGTNRWQLNQSKNVGKTSELIRICSPKNDIEWKKFYFENARTNTKIAKTSKRITREKINQLGLELHKNISEKVSKELENISEKECIDYMFNLVINRTFNGYETERRTVYGQLSKKLRINIEKADDDIDRKLNVDFLIDVNNYKIGLQIKPLSNSTSIPQIHIEKKNQLNSHEKFKNKFKGKVFYVFSIKKEIFEEKNLLKEIRKEIIRLKNLK